MLVNGHYQDSLPLSDRAIHYGDGVFETLLVRHRVPLLLNFHLERLVDACHRLHLPLDLAPLEKEIHQAIVHAKDSHGVLKIIITRGSGGRGYTPPASPQPTRIVQWHGVPPDLRLHAEQGIEARLCRHPLSENSVLAGLKHLNRLDQVMASAELDPHVQEGLMCDSKNSVIEGIKSNLFIKRLSHWSTPSLDHCGVAGVMRRFLLEHGFARVNVPVEIAPLKVADLERAEGLFVCNSVIGIWPVNVLLTSENTLSYPIPPEVRDLQALWDGWAT